MTQPRSDSGSFHLMEATLADIQGVFRAGDLSVRELVQLYLDRIEAYDRNGPAINSVITINPHLLDEASALDRGKKPDQAGPLYGVPVMLKDQIDAQGMPTTMGSVLFKDYYPDRDAFVVERLKRAGALILGKATLGELGGGDTHGSLFGSTKNPYSLERTVGGSSGGPAAAVAANFAAIAVGQEGFASIRRPSAWNAIVGMRPTVGLVSRAGSFGGFPSVLGSLGPMTRTVGDLAILLDALVGYDPEDPISAHGVGHRPATFTSYLDVNGLKGARIGILREPMGLFSEPGSEDFGKVAQVFDRAVGELEAQGAVLIDPIEIPGLNDLLPKRSGAGAGGSGDVSWKGYFGRSARYPFKTREEMLNSPDYAKVVRRGPTGSSAGGPATHYEYLVAREQLLLNLLKVMADFELDAIVHKTVEHQPTLIRDAFNPPYTTMKGATHVNTFLAFVPSISVPAGTTSDGLPAGITFLGRPYRDALMVKLAYAYEQGTHHRRPPTTTGPLPGEP